jgi:hypothetical protein
MDEVMCGVENPGNILHEVNEQLFTTDNKKNSDSFQSTMSNKLPIKSNLDIEESSSLSTERILSSKMQLNLQEEDKNLQSERFHDEIKSRTKNDLEILYLMECIKLHQSSIK